MAKLAKFNEIVRDFKDVADFAIIYISEAHPTDGWAFKVSAKSLQLLTRLKVLLHIQQQLYELSAGNSHTAVESLMLM